MKKTIIVFLCFSMGAGIACQSKSAATSAQAAASPAPVQKILPPVDGPKEDISKVIGGIPTGSESFKKNEDIEEWKNFSKYLDERWKELETVRLTPMAAWAGSELSEARKASGVLFYPFGGPDILTAYQLFPDADTYILMGLELCGTLPRLEGMSVEEWRVYLDDLKSSLKDIFSKSYFITSHMDETLYGKVDGVLPIFALFMKRMGLVICGVTRIEFNEKAEAVEIPYETVRKPKRPSGIKVTFRKADSDRLQTLLYFSCDLEDKAFAKNGPLHRYLDGLETAVTFVKSASYLMHYAEFSNIRNICLAKSRFILEDDTGIPYKRFNDGGWEIRLFGTYAKPIKDFSGVDQPDLQKAYSDPNAAKPLPFHLGYHWRDNRDALLLLKKKITS